MLKQGAVIYVALVAVLEGLLLAGVSVEWVFFVGVFVLMLAMHMGGHGSGHGGHGEHGTRSRQARRLQVGSAPKQDGVAGR